MIKYYIRDVHGSYSPQTGTAVQCRELPELRFFVGKNVENKWTVTESTTGLAASDLCDKRKDAIESFAHTIERVGAEKFRAAVEDAVARCGCAPKPETITTAKKATTTKKLYFSMPVWMYTSSGRKGFGPHKIETVANVGGVNYIGVARVHTSRSKTMWSVIDRNGQIINFGGRTGFSTRAELENDLIPTVANGSGKLFGARYGSWDEIARKWYGIDTEA